MLLLQFHEFLHREAFVYVAEWPEIEVPEEVARKAVKPIERMLELSK